MASIWPSAYKLIGFSNSSTENNVASSFNWFYLVIIFQVFVPFAGGPYGLFSGRDASRALATFSLSEDSLRDEYDDLSDLNSMQMESVREWEMQFTGM